MTFLSTQFRVIILKKVNRYSICSWVRMARKIQIKLDTGAQVNCIPSSVYNSILASSVNLEKNGLDMEGINWKFLANAQ